MGVHVVHRAEEGGGAAAGGMLGAFVIGMQRSVYSSEAGVGSAVIAHAQAKTREPASEGLVALLEPFIDTKRLVGHRPCWKLRFVGLSSGNGTDINAQK